MTKPKEILAKHNLRNTTIRKEILDVFLASTSALSQSDIEEHFDSALDRVTLYRNLKTFEQQGIIHKIEDGGISHYALCVDCEEQNHHDDHIHFKCTSCSQVECVELQNQIPIAIPDGYTVEKVNILLEGICKVCN